MWFCLPVRTRGWRNVDIEVELLILACSTMLLVPLGLEVLPVYEVRVEAGRGLLHSWELRSWLVILDILVQWASLHRRRWLDILRGLELLRNTERPAKDMVNASEEPEMEFSSLQP